MKTRKQEFDVLLQELEAFLPTSKTARQLQFGLDMMRIGSEGLGEDWKDMALLSNVDIALKQVLPRLKGP